MVKGTKMIMNLFGTSFSFTSSLKREFPILSGFICPMCMRGYADPSDLQSCFERCQSERDHADEGGGGANGSQVWSSTNTLLLARLKS